jgi:cyanophycin synthetase
MDDFFSLSARTVFPGPSTELSLEAVVFDLVEHATVPLDTLWGQTVDRLPKLADERPPAAFPELLARLVVAVQQLEMDLYARNWAVRTVDGAHRLAIQYVDPNTCLACIDLVEDWLHAALEGLDFPYGPRFEECLHIFTRSRFGGPTIYSLLEAGYQSGIPAMYLRSEDVVQWGQGRKQLRGRSTVLHRDSIKDTELTTYKDRAKAFLEDLGLPVPHGEVVLSLNEAEFAARRVGFPVVIKPVVGHKGQGVTTGVCSEHDIKYAFDVAREASGSPHSDIIVEKEISGTDHRLLTVKGKFVAALQRIPAYVSGDGRHSIEELIETENARPERADTPRSPMGKILIDDDLVQFLHGQGRSLHDVPREGEEVVLRRVANISAGGVSVNVTDAIHPANVKLAEDVAKFLNVLALGIDLLAEDISKPWTESPCAIIEINAGPGIFMHLVPARGESIDVPRLILRSVFPTADAARIPTLVFNRLTETLAARLTDVALRYAGVHEVGVAKLDGLFFNGVFFSRRPRHIDTIRNMMRSPRLDLALIEYDEGHLVAEGTYHWGADVVVLDEPTQMERATLTRDLLPGGLTVELDRGGDRLLRQPAGGALETRSANGSIEDALLQAIESVLAERIDRYNVRNAVVD